MKPGRLPEGGGRWRPWAQVLGTTVVLALLLRLFVLDAYRIPSASMAETLLPGDCVLVNKLLYGAPLPRLLPLTSAKLPALRFPGFRSPARGDVVVFTLDSITYVKRCVAIPGDTVECSGTRVLVNGEDAADSGPALRSSAGPPGGVPRTAPAVVPRRGDVLRPQRGTLTFLLRLIEREGHRVEFGPGERLLVDGRPCATYTVEENHYFVLGDNRGNSLDSRVLGLIPESSMIGRALMIYWSSTLQGDQDGAGRVRWSRLGRVIR